MADTERLARRVAELQQELDQLRSDLRGLDDVPRSAGPAETMPQQIRQRRSSSRRTLLRTGAGALGAGIAGAALLARPVAATDGDTVKVGASHSGTGSTRVISSGIGQDALHGWATATSGNGWGARGDSNSPTGVGVRGAASSSTGSAAGVEGVSISDNGVGVRGRNGASTGEALGVLGTTDSSSGIGVAGLARTGVRGTSENGFGVGVLGRNTAVGGSGIGVLGSAKAESGAGVFAQNDRGVGVAGVGGGVTGVGGEFSGGRAAIALLATGADPSTSSTFHAVGDVYFDSSNDLWFCTKSGTPGTWFKITAKGLTPVSPFRVYDSRFTDGPLGRGTNRLVTVRDSIDVATGAVVKQNAVPGGATAVLFNLAITNTVGAGFVAATPGNTTSSASASINWSSSDQTLNNGTFVQLDVNRRMRAFVNGTPGASTDFVIDVTGFILA